MIPDDRLVLIKDAIFRGEKIAALKLYRKATGVGLAEAKAAVEKLEAELRSSSPDQFRPVESRGCLGLVLVLVVLTGAVIYFSLRVDIVPPC